jgi:hypothetical protein
MIEKTYKIQVTEMELTMLFFALGAAMAVLGPSRDPAKSEVHSIYKKLRIAHSKEP